MNNHKLFCIPYAGGHKQIFYPLKDHINENIIVIPLELPGRGNRFKESLLSNIYDMAEDITQQIIAYNLKSYSILGYSLGAIVLYEVYYRLKKLDVNLPTNLFFCSMESLGNDSLSSNVKNMNTKEFKSFIFQKNGTPKEILENEELWNIFYPILKSDFMAIDSYPNKLYDNLINSNVNVFMGKDDNIEDDIYYWSNISQKAVNYNFFEGDHFFIHEDYKNLANKISEIIKNNW